MVVNVPLAIASLLFLTRQLNIKRRNHAVILLRRLKLDILSSIDKSGGQPAERLLVALSSLHLALAYHSIRSWEASLILNDV